MKQFYLTRKVNSLVSTILILLGLKEENIGLTTAKTNKNLINFDSRNSFGLYSFKAALVFLFFVFGIGNNVFGQATTVSASTAGTYTWTCPPGVTSVSVSCWGAGGAGGGINTTGVNRAAGGGGVSCVWWWW